MTYEKKMVDAAPVLEHVRALVAKGMSVNAIARAVGRNNASIGRFKRGYYRNDKNEIVPVTTCSPHMRDLLLAVKFQEDEVASTFCGELVTRARKKSGTTLAELARRTGMDVNTVRRWERGESHPRFRGQVEKVALTLGVPYDSFFGPAGPEEVEDSLDAYVYRPNGQDDFIMSGYPCGVCGREFRSRAALATHPHVSTKSRKVREEDLV